MITTVPKSILYETIHSQPAAIRAVLDEYRPQAEQAAELIGQAGRVYVIGTGTSSHAAMVGEYLLRSVGVDSYATTNFDFVTYSRPLGSNDVLVAFSHRGNKRYGQRALDRAREAGVKTIGITGYDSGLEGPEVIIRTVPQERSSCHTASYTVALAALASIAAYVGDRKGADARELRTAVERLPDDVASILTRENEIVPAAEALAKRGRLVLVGAGPNHATAREGALKVKESSYLVAEGIELETVLHGPLVAVEAGDVSAVIAAHGPALERTLELVRLLGIIGAHRLVVADERVAKDVPDGAEVITYAAVPEALSPILSVIPLQLLAAYTAELRGANADNFRVDDPVYRRLKESYTL